MAGPSNLFNPRCCGGTPTTIEPYPDCHGPVPGTHATITRVSDGVVVWDDDTDSHGRIRLSLTVGASYAMTVDGYGSPRWADSTTFVGPVGTGVSLVVLPRAPGYVCYGNCTYPISNRMLLEGARDSPVLLAFGPIPELAGALGYRGTVPTEGDYSLPGGEDIYWVHFRGGSIVWDVGGTYAPGHGDPYGGAFGWPGFANCSDFAVTWPIPGLPSWTMTEAPPVP